MNERATATAMSRSRSTLTQIETAIAIADEHEGGGELRQGHVDRRSGGHPTTVPPRASFRHQSGHAGGLVRVVGDEHVRQTDLAAQLAAASARSSRGRPRRARRSARRAAAPRAPARASGPASRAAARRPTAGAASRSRRRRRARRARAAPHVGRAPASRAANSMLSATVPSISAGSCGTSDTCGAARARRGRARRGRGSGPRPRRGRASRSSSRSRLDFPSPRARDAAAPAGCPRSSSQHDIAGAGERRRRELEQGRARADYAGRLASRPMAAHAGSRLPRPDGRARRGGSAPGEVEEPGTTSCCGSTAPRSAAPTCIPTRPARDGGGIRAGPRVPRHDRGEGRRRHPVRGGRARGRLVLRGLRQLLVLPPRGLHEVRDDPGLRDGLGDGRPAGRAGPVRARAGGRPHPPQAPRSNGLRAGRRGHAVRGRHPHDRLRRDPQDRHAPRRLRGRDRLRPGRPVHGDGGARARRRARSWRWTWCPSA